MEHWHGGSRSLRQEEVEYLVCILDRSCCHPELAKIAQDGAPSHSCEHIDSPYFRVFSTTRLVDPNMKKTMYRCRFEEIEKWNSAIRVPPLLSTARSSSSGCCASCRRGWSGLPSSMLLRFNGGSVDPLLLR